MADKKTNKKLEPIVNVLYEKLKSFKDTKQLHRKEERAEKTRTDANTRQ